MDNLAAGTAAGLMVLYYEISRQRVINKLREGERRFRLLADTAPVLIWMSGPDKLCTYFNNTWLKFTGRSVEEELGNGWAEGVHPDDLKMCMETYTQSFDRREKFEVEYRFRRHEGEYRWVYDVGVPRYNADRSFAGYIGSCVDITERRLTEEALREKEGQLSEAQRLARVGSWQWNVRNDQVNWSEELYRIAGRDPTSPVPGYKEHSSIFTAESWELLQRAVEKALRDGTSWDIDLEMVRPDGTTRWVRGRGEPVRDSTGPIFQLRGTVQDITERKLAEEALARVGGRLIEAHEEERAWIARELHDDIAQRLALLAVNLDRMQQDPTDAVAEIRKHVSEQLKRVQEISSDVQAISHRLHSSKLRSLGIVVSTRSFCQEFAEQNKVQIDFTHTDIPRTVPEEISLCLFRVMQEALQNGVKHSGVRHFEVDLRGAPDGIHLTVHDAGLGFAPEELVSKRGLGLISMQERVNLVNGTFSIDSRPGCGTTIHAGVPLSSSGDSARAAGE